MDIFFVKWHTYLNHFVYVTFRASEFCRILYFNQNNKVQVMPHVVFGPSVFLKGHVFIVKGFSFQS